MLLMARFKTEDDMLDAMGGAYYANGHGKAPAGMTTAQKKASVAPIFYAWSECKCTGVPGSLKRRDYYVHDIESCPKHAHVKGNFTDDLADV
jgi:hypothetical protein